MGNRQCKAVFSQSDIERRESCLGLCIQLGAVFNQVLDQHIRAPIRGAVNGTAPNPVPNAEFTRSLAAAVHRPAILPVPALAMKLLYGEMSQLLFDSQRVLPKVAENMGFRFRFTQLSAALADLLK